MAKDTSEDDAEKDKSKGKSGGKKKMLIIVLVAVVVALGGGGAGGYMLFAPKTAAPEPPPKPGIVVPLDPVTINLKEGHYLKLGLALQATDKVAEAPAGAKALDAAIDLFSNRTVAELSSDEERKAMKKELAKKCSEAYEKEIMDVYFTEFVMQ